MPTSVTVWAVELVPQSSLEEVRGSLALATDTLVFTPRDERRPERRLALTDITQIRRLRGSPVLMIACDGPDEPRRTAFYFAQPPPLDRHDEPARPTFPGVGRNTRRRVRKQNASYLGMWNREKKALLRDWELRIKMAVAAARG